MEQKIRLQIKEFEEALKRTESEKLKADYRKRIKKRKALLKALKQERSLKGEGPRG